MQSVMRTRLADFRSSRLITSNAVAWSTQWKAVARAVTSSTSEAVSWARSVRFALDNVAVSSTLVANSIAVSSDLGSSALQAKKRWIATHFAMSTGVVVSSGKSPGCIHPMSAA